jgi:hypothetical protein
MVVLTGYRKLMRNEAIRIFERFTAMRHLTVQQYQQFQPIAKEKAGSTNLSASLM